MGIEISVLACYRDQRPYISVRSRVLRRLVQELRAHGVMRRLSWLTSQDDHSHGKDMKRANGFAQLERTVHKVTCDDL